MKHVYGAYLNMARQNAYITLAHISKLLGDNTEQNEANLSQMKAIRVLRDGKVEEVDKAIKLLHKHFPFLKAMADNKLGQMVYQENEEKRNNPDQKQQNTNKNTPQIGAVQYKAMLEAIFETLNLLRNQYSHYHFEDSKLTEEKYLGYNKNIVYGMKNAFEGGRRMVKERFELKDDDLKFIIDNIRKSERYIDDKGKTKYKFVEDERFFYKLDNSDKLMSAKGIAFFICLFLEKKYITLFLDNPELRFFALPKKEEERKIIREIFGIYRIRLPRTRIESDRPASALGLDILNELKKCPDELFDTLKKEDQDKFRILTENIDGKDDADNNEILMKRYYNRFSYFALRYIDDNNIFEHIRFQVSLGKYRYKFYEKRGIDSNTADRIRILQKELNGFGRLNDIEEKRREMWEGLIRPFEDIKQDTAEEKPYITDHRASYILDGNKIAMGYKRGIEPSFERGYYLPSITPENHDEYEAKEVVNRKPNCWLSTHELPAMLFHHLLCDSNDKTKTEVIIKTFVTNYKKLFEAIKDGKLRPSTKEEIGKTLKETYQIDFKDIPEKLQNYLTNKQVDIDARFKKLSDDKLDKMIAWTDRRIESFAKDKTMIGRKDNKLGKKKYVDIRPGRLARFLSEDIVLMQPSVNEGKNKPTGMNFQIIQSSLAIYDKSVDELRRMFDQAGLTNGDYSHPFLENVLGEYPNDSISFYETYLTHRLEYLQNCKKDKKYSEYSFLYSSRNKWKERNEQYYKELAKKYLDDQPIELPRGLFAQAIKEKLKNIESMQQALSQERCNTSYLIAEYFKHVCEDANQKFYSFDRSYDFYNNLNDKRINTFDSKKEQALSLDILEVYSDKNTLAKSIGEYMKRKVGDVEETKQSLAKSSINAPLIKTFLMLDENQFKGPYKKLFKKTKQQLQNNEGVEYIEQISTLLEVTGVDIEQIRSEPKSEKIEYNNVKYEAFPEYKKIMAQVKDYQKNEKSIRQYKVQDMLLFLMAKNILIKNDWGKDSDNIKNEVESYKLENIDPKTETNILSLSVPFSIKIKLKDGIEKTIKQDSLKIKNYGDFFRFLYDDRIQTLLPQIETIEVDRKLLEEELEKYDIKRVDLFNIALAFERQVWDQHSTDITNQSPSFRELVTLFNIQNDTDREKFIEIRNAFSHNRYTDATIKTLPKVAIDIYGSFEKLAGVDKK